MTLLGWSFAAPALLWGLLALPILWLILRAIPPAPIRKRFPAVVLLLGLRDNNRSAQRTPWWLLLLRALAIAAAIVGFAGPSRTPQTAPQSQAPLLIVMDSGWAEAQDWPALRAAALQALADAGRAGRAAAVLHLTDGPTAPQWQAADALRAALSAANPAPRAPADFAAWAKLLGGTARFDTLWFSDGLDHAGRSDLLAALQAAGRTEVVLPARAAIALAPAKFDAGQIKLTALRLPAPAQATAVILAIGAAPNGSEAELARISVTFAAGAGSAAASLHLPPELRNRITRFEIEGLRSAGAISLTDDALKRRKVAIISAAADAEGLQLLSPTHYLTQALAPSSDLLQGGISDVLPARPDTIILADVAKISAEDTAALTEWVTAGGTLLRFAGPRLAAMGERGAVEGAEQTSEIATDLDPLLPVRLRAGGRATGGAMTWGAAKLLAPFDTGSPFAGLAIGPEITVSSQVLAQPSPDLAAATLATLADGTPLVTRRKLGAGQIVLFHITANAEWSSLPLSVLFVQMLERLAVASRTAGADQAEVVAQVWQPLRLTGPFGAGEDGAALAGVAGADLWRALQNGPARGTPAGLYNGQTRKLALNIMGEGGRMTRFDWPASVVLRSADLAQAAQGKGPLLALALALLAVDSLASLALGGRLFGRSPAAMGAAAVCIAAALAPAPPALAQTAVDPTTPPTQSAEPTESAGDFAALRATQGVVLAHVLTGDTALDDTAEAGLRGLGEVLSYRTSIEPEAPVAVDIETDVLDFYPFLYWPISANQPLPSPAAIAKLNRFMRTGGMIMFDTGAADMGGAAARGPAGDMLQLLTAGLDIPPLEPVPQDHVLTRSFYLISDFPGRYEGAETWVEAAPQGAEDAPEGMPFRNLNDGVSPVIIGGNDWASAWAVDEDLSYLHPVGRGFAGEEQREYAFRFGVNVIMHVLTGNYKSDQVHVPALLDRLGQ